MTEYNFNSFVSPKFKYEYQEGTVQEVELISANGNTILVSYVLVKK